MDPSGFRRLRAGGGGRNGNGDRSYGRAPRVDWRGRPLGAGRRVGGAALAAESRAVAAAAAAPGTTRRARRLAERRLRAQARRLGGGSSTDLLNVMLNYLTQGAVTTPFCLGDQDHCDARDYVRSIPGEVAVALNGGLELKVTAAKVSLGAFVYNVAGGADGFGEDLVGMLDSVGRMGLQKVELSLLVADGYVLLSGRGYPDFGMECEGVVGCFLQDAAESLAIRPSVKLIEDGSFEFEPVEVPRNT